MLCFAPKLIQRNRTRTSVAVLLLLRLGSELSLSHRAPHAGEQQDLRCAAGCITRLQLSHDDGMLVAAAADGCLLVFDVRDRDVTRLGKGCGTKFRSQPISLWTPLDALVSKCLLSSAMPLQQHEVADQVQHQIQRRSTRHCMPLRKNLGWKFSQLYACCCVLRCVTMFMCRCLQGSSGEAAVRRGGAGAEGRRRRAPATHLGAGASGPMH